MENIEEIWNSHQVNKFSNNKLDGIPTVTTNSELDNLNRVLRIEIIVELFLTFVIIILKNQIKEIAWYMSLLIAFCGLFFSFYGFYLSKKVRLEDSSFLFLNNTTQILKHFAIKYTLFIQVILFLVYLILGLTSESESFLTWAKSIIGIKTGLLILIINIICSSYGYFFYIKRYLRLKNVIEDF